jgi:hypothetical protein
VRRKCTATPCPQRRKHPRQKMEIRNLSDLMIENQKKERKKIYPC